MTSDPYPTCSASSMSRGRSRFSSERNESSGPSSRCVALAGGDVKVLVDESDDETAAGALRVGDSRVEGEGLVAEFAFLNANFGLRVFVAETTVCSDLSSCSAK